MGSAQPRRRSDVRLRDRRSGLRRMRAGGAPLRGPGRQRAAARGRAAGREREHPRPARLPEAGPHRGRLGLLDGAGAQLQRPPHLPPPRQGARRLLLDQRDGLHPRQPRRLRRLGRPGLGLGRPLPLLPQGRGQRARRLRVARRRRAAAGLRPALRQRHHPRLRRGRAPKPGWPATRTSTAPSRTASACTR